MERLLPCPFCGGKARVMLEEEDRPDDSFHNVYCTECGAMFWVKSKTEAIAKWNSRVEPDEIDRLRAELARERERYAGIDPDRLREICEAEPDGRCYTPPVKVFGTVWDRRGVEWTVTRIEISPYGNTLIRCSHKGTDDYACFSAEDLGEDVYLTKQESKPVNTRAEAEAALGKGDADERFEAKTVSDLWEKANN